MFTTVIANSPPRRTCPRYTAGGMATSTAAITAAPERRTWFQVRFTRPFRPHHEPLSVR